MRRLLLATFIICPVLALADEMIVYYPEKPGDTKAAEPVMQALAGHLQKAGGFSSLNATYFNQEKAALQHLADKNPQYGIVSFAVYLNWKLAGRPVTPIAQAEIRGATSERWHLFVSKKSSKTKLEELKGGTVVTGLLRDPAFATKIVFAKAIAAGTDVALVNTRLPAAIRHCAEGKKLGPLTIDGILLNEDEVHSSAGIRQMADLKEIWASRPLPTPIVVAFPNAEAVQTKKLQNALFKMREAAPEGPAVLEQIQTTGFREVDAAAFSAFEKEYRE